MSLKTATVLAAYCFVIALIIRVINWIAITFDLLSYSDFAWLYSAFWLLDDLLVLLPLIIFFFVLNARQRGQ